MHRRSDVDRGWPTWKNRAVGNRLFFSFARAFAAGALFAVTLSAAAIEPATGSPAETIASLQQGLVAAASEKRNATIDERYRALEPLIAGTHNLPYIAEFALRRQWASLTEADRQRFVAAFERLSVMTYAARFKAIGADTFRAVTPGAADASGRVQVATAVARESQPDVSLEYLLQQDEKGWRIVNVIADGVSDLALKRAEYQRLFASGGLDGLLAELDAQTERLRQD
jgi:phospholipid transport system substrate-binding protein